MTLVMKQREKTTNFTSTYMCA